MYGRTEVLMGYKRFSLSAWHDYHLDDYGGQFHFARFRVDWSLRPGMLGPWFSVDIGFLGLNLSLTYWPKDGE